MTIEIKDKLTLYTNRRCPWAHRAHIALIELDLPFEEVEVDLDTPRTAEYLAINPRGLVPTLKVNDDIVIESGIVAQYLADAYPSHLVAPSNEPGAALQRAKISIFADSFINKVQSHLWGALFADADELPAIQQKAVEGIVKDVEPLLADAKPFFGGSDKLTLAEVLTGSFALRLAPFADAGLYPPNLVTEIEQRAPNTAAWIKAVSAHPSVNTTFDAENVIFKTREKREKVRAERAAAAKAK